MTNSEVGIGVRYTWSLLVVGLIFGAVWFEEVEVVEHNELVELYEDKEAVEAEDITTDIRLEGRPKINTESKR